MDKTKNKRFRDVIPCEYSISKQNNYSSLIESWLSQKKPSFPTGQASNCLHDRLQMKWTKIEYMYSQISFAGFSLVTINRIKAIGFAQSHFVVALLLFSHPDKDLTKQKKIQ